MREKNEQSFLSNNYFLKCSNVCGYSCAKCCCKISIKRYFLPLIGIFGLLVIQELRDYIYIPLIFFLGCIIIFWNFPYIIYSTNSKPVYYEDLFIDETKLPNYNVSEKIKRKFESIFLWSLIITNSLLMAALSDYWFYKSNGFHFDNLMQIIGITGGVIKIFSMVNYYIGLLLIELLHKLVNDENRKNLRKIKEDLQESVDKLNNSKNLIKSIISDSPVFLASDKSDKEYTIEMINLENNKTMI